MKFEHLIGRQFELGKADCFALARDFYKDNFNIEVPNYARPKDWNADKFDLIDRIHNRHGFFKVYDWSFRTLRPGDILCMAVGSSHANHLAVYVGENRIVHHLVSQFSREETLRDFWRNSTCYVLRHSDVPDLTVQKPTTTIRELVDARNRIKAEA